MTSETQRIEQPPRRVSRKIHAGLIAGMCASLGSVGVAATKDHFAAQLIGAIAWNAFFFSEAGLIGWQKRQREPRKSKNSSWGELTKSVSSYVPKTDRAVEDVRDPTHLGPDGL